MTDDAGYRIDLHVKILNDQVVARAKRRGLDAIVYAPHFTRIDDASARAEQFSDEALQVFPARELFTGHWNTRKHLLAIGMETPIPDFITLDATIDELNRQDAAVLVPHPTFLTVSLSAEEIRERVDDIDAIEVYNPKHWPYHNKRARKLAESTELPGFASSYAHLLGTVGEAWTTFTEPIASEAELVTAIREGNYQPMHRSGWSHRRCKLLEFGHLAWENSWEKLDRIFLSGTAPTHPDHVAYGGRFDEVRVY